MRDALALPRLFMTVSLLAGLGCDANLGSVTTQGSGSEGDDSTTGEHEPIACIGGELCPSGTSCANGVCASECGGDSDCAADEYCGLDDLCHPRAVPGCVSDAECAATQTCVNEICTTLADSSCDLEDYLQDGCPSNAVCLEDPDSEGQGVCYEMPACAADQSCPIGIQGAVCNSGFLVNKDEICLIGMCSAVADCPAAWSCVRYNNAVLGVCSNGGLGSPCSSDEHCTSMSCVLIPGLGGGFCG